MKSHILGASFLCFGAAFGLIGCRSGPTAPLWDVPSLVGQPIDVATQKLGSPQSSPTQQPTSPAPNLGQSTWTKEDATLSATWKTGSKRVTSWTLISRDESHALREEERAQLLLPGKLKENDPAYSLDWVESPERPLFYTGVKVVPAAKNYDVKLRVTGALGLLQVTYQVGGPQPKTETLLTVAPWEMSVNLPDDAPIQISSEIVKSMGASNFNMKVEILVNGKVVSSDASTGPAIQCQYEL